MTFGPSSSEPIPPVQNDIIQSQRSQQAQNLSRLAINQEASQDNFQEWADQFAVNTMAFARRAENLETKLRKREKYEDIKKEEALDEGVEQIAATTEVAEEFEQKNPEIKARALLVVRERIKEDDTLEDIIRKVTEAYPDPSLADDALDFLSQTSKGELQEKIKEARAQFNQRFEREIRAGKNIYEVSRRFAQEGLGNPEGLRNMYRDITGTPKDPHTLFNELVAKFSYEKMKTVIAYLLHSLGNDLKSKGPSIDKGELFRLFSEARTLQAILGVYRYFMLKMKPMKKSMLKHEISIDSKVNFENFAKVFMKYLQDRYPNSEKVLLMSKEFGIYQDLVAQEIVFSVMVDALRHISPKLLRSQQHRQEVMTSFLEALDEIEEKLDEEEDEDEEEK